MEILVQEMEFGIFGYLEQIDLLIIWPTAIKFCQKQ